MELGEVDVEHQIEGVVRRVAPVFDGSVAVADIEAEVRRCFAAWADAPVRDFVPVLAERQVRDRIRREQSAASGRWPSSVS
jgi:hypothetical protein